MIEGKFFYGNEGLKTGAYIRSMVFTEEQGVHPSIEQDIYDQFAQHLVVSDGIDLVGTGRLIYKDEKFLIGRIAVLPSARGNGYGDLIVRMLCTRAFDIGAKEVVVHSQIQVEDFYSKIGFKTISDVYQEAGIDHVTMVIEPSSFLHPCDSCSSCDSNC